MSQPNLLMILQLLWLIPVLLSLIGLFLSMWIVIPAPTMSLLPLGVGAPEVSPWLLVINAIALLLTALIHKHWLFYLVLFMSVIGLCLSLWPILQFSATNAQIAQDMERVLGADYLAHIPQTFTEQMRSQPLVLKDVFRGIPQPEVRIKRGVIFASPDGVDLKLNLYQPLATGKYPALIIIYGGGWKNGTPDGYEQFSCYMANHGYAVVAIDYRHAPQYKFPTQLEDVRTALAYIQAKANDLEIDSTKMAIMGRSAGGHLATLAAYQPDALPFRAVISYYGAVNLTEGYYDPPVPNPINTQAILRDFLGGTPEEFPELYQQASPINYPRPNLPPSLLVYGGRDHITQPKFGRQLQHKLEVTDNSVILLEIPWAEHAFDAIFPGISNQLALYYTERFLAWALK